MPPRKFVPRIVAGSPREKVTLQFDNELRQGYKGHPGWTGEDRTWTARRGRPKLGALMDEGENDVRVITTFPRAHWTQIYSTNPLKRLNAEIKRRTNVVGIFPNDASIGRLVGAMMLEQSDEWSLNRR